MPTAWYLFGHAEVAHVLAGRGFGRSSPLTARAAPVPDGYVTLRRVVENWLVFLDPPRHTRLRARVAAERWPWFRSRAPALPKAGGTRGDRTPAAMDEAERAAAELDGYFHRELAGCSTTRPSRR
ncbi:hypothetical protein [Streptomyces sp. NPDC015130]|uniref:hypothetical protein n=1 Tax=Streptomyces sp. NPDC015130 TaxID=3364940 RepID=UPI0036FFC5B8